MNDNVKELLEKVKEKSAAAAEYATKKAGEAGKKAGELWETAVLHKQIFFLNNDLNGIYRQMGELVYAAHVDPEVDTAAIDTLLEEAEAKLAEITDRRERIARLKQDRRCDNPECGKPLDKDDTYCRACGTPVTQEEAETEPEQEVDEKDG